MERGSGQEVSRVLNGLRKGLGLRVVVQYTSQNKIVRVRVRVWGLWVSIGDTIRVYKAFERFCSALEGLGSRSRVFRAFAGLGFRVWG